MREIAIKTENGDMEITPDSHKGIWALHAQYAPHFKGRYKKWTLTHVPTGLSVLRSIPSREKGREIMKEVDQRFSKFDHENDLEKQLLGQWLKDVWYDYMF